MAIFQSWAEYPRRILPEGGQYTLTSLVLRYLSARSIFHAERHDSDIVGQLVDEHNTPLPNAPVVLYTRPLHGKGPSGWNATTGVVPEGAIRASFAVSMNRECACNAESSILLEKFEYAERVGESDANVGRFDSNFREWKSQGSGKVSIDIGSGVEIVTASGQETRFESPQFAATPGATFEARALFQAPFGTEAGGLGIVRFFDGANKEVRRTYILLSPNWTKIVETETQKDGTFHVSLNKEFDPDQFALKVTYSGSETYRPSQFDFRPREK
jgi:hypothetical protein